MGAKKNKDSLGMDLVTELDDADGVADAVELHFAGGRADGELVVRHPADVEDERRRTGRPPWLDQRVVAQIPQIDLRNRKPFSR